ncbi:mitogen-activated protein kinase p38b-like [Eriocheir sinensis]|uniref:mitogen-activated protein kinase p38b-like n=1 Tax=Eriocheir sinensis TaxID=95602 RepID=UPI0021C69926|nr:mitogen-activated protein kinase p38b-like [Eriocheir sinensis]
METSKRKHECLDVLGEGAFGVVLRAMYGGQDAVVKIPRLGAVHAHYFRHEAQVLHHLDGAGGTPRLLHLGPPEDPKIVMTYSGSTTFQDLLDDEVLDGQGVVQVFHSAALKLQEVHAKGVVHNDLKEDNVMVDAKPTYNGCYEASLIDFGLSKFVEGVQLRKFKLQDLYGAEVDDEGGDPANDVMGLGNMLEEVLNDMDWPWGEEALRRDLASLAAVMTSECGSERTHLDQVILRLQVLLSH